MSVRGSASRRLLPLAVLAAVTVSGCANTNFDLGLASSLAPAQEATVGVATEPAAAQPQRTAAAEPSRTSEAPTIVSSRQKGEGSAGGALAEARALRLSGDKAGALAILEKAAESSPKDTAVLKERALLTLELGQIAKAEQQLKSLIDPKAPDWRILSGYGAALAASGKHQQAQLQFAKALELAPDHPAILNNLALSYALDGKSEDAERLLARAAQTGQKSAPGAQARQNLALIVGLKGRTDEAVKISSAVLPPAQARANADYLSKSAGVEPVSERSEGRSGGSGQRTAALGEASESVMRLGAKLD